MPAYAASSLEIVDYQKEISADASSSATIKLFVQNKPGTQYYLAAAFCEDPCRDNFGKTFVGAQWVAYGEKNRQQFYPIITDTGALWEGGVGLMADISDTGYKGPKEYFLRVGYFTAGAGEGASPNWVNNQKVAVNITDSSWGLKSVVMDDIAHIRQLPRGTKVQTHGLVTVEQGPLGADVFYIEDDFAGIKVDLPKDFKSGVRLGDKVQVGCTVEESRGEKYIKVEDGDSVSVLETNLVCRNPTRIRTGDILDDWEGRFIEVEAPVVGTSGDTFYLDDGSGRIKIYIRDSTGIDKPPMRRGDTAKARGIISQWGQHDDGSDNYRLMLRYNEDLVVYPAMVDDFEEAKESTSSGEVLGAVTQLPETGGGLWVIFAVAAVLVCTLLSSPRKRGSRELDRFPPARE